MGYKRLVSPRQKWLFKKIGNSWKDKDYIIRETVFECLVHFVESEKGLELLEYNAQHPKNPVENRDRYQEVVNDLSECYAYITKDRPDLENQLDNAYPINLSSDPRGCLKKTEDGFYIMKSCEERSGMSYQEAYAEVHRLENLIEQKDSEVMNLIIKHRSYMWT